MLSAFILADLLHYTTQNTVMPLVRGVVPAIDLFYSNGLWVQNSRLDVHEARSPFSCENSYGLSERFPHCTLA